MGCIICNVLVRAFPLLWAGVIVSWIEEWDGMRPLLVAAFTGTLVYAIRESRNDRSGQDPAVQLVDALMATRPRTAPGLYLVDEANPATTAVPPASTG